MPTEIIEAKEIYRGFIALRLVDGARVSREIIEHSKAATVLEAHQYQHCQHERRAKLPLKPQSAKQETCPAQYASSRRPRITMGECTGHRRPKSHSLSKNSWKGIVRRWGSFVHR
jgi:hypothetical protein